jgi:6-phosphogluconolactonase
VRAALHSEENTLLPFDLVYLGLGDNAHTASLMPEDAVVAQYVNTPTHAAQEQLAAALFMPETNLYRITLTPSALNNALDIIFLVTGENKATAVWNVLEGQSDPLHYPAQLIQGLYQKTIWYLDQAAAEKLPTVDSEYDK